jgi:hypothetical protein
MLSENGGCFVPAEPSQLRAAQVLAGDTLYLSVGELTGNEPGTVGLYADVRPLVHIGASLGNQGTVNKAGQLTVRGTVSCDGAVDYPGVYVKVSATQKSGHGYITAENATSVDCNSGTSSWSLSLQPGAGGKFVAGRATVNADASCSAFAPLCTTVSIPPTSVKVAATK